MMGELIPIVAIVMVFGIPMLAIWTGHQKKMAQLQVDATAEHTAEKAAQYASHVQELENRVRVLERIVTDKGYDVATQIEALRDQRSVDETSAAGVPLNIEDKEKA
jgi:IS5 family transposase